MNRAPGRRAIPVVCLAAAVAGLWLVSAGAASSATGAASPARAARASSPLALGIFDGVFTGRDGPLWLGRAAAAGAQWVRIDIGWVAPFTTAKPAGFDPRNPADPHYDFTAADAVIRTAAQDGLKVDLTFNGAPPWAEGGGRPASAMPGTWRPDPQALADYGTALARRYSGSFPDPLHPGRALPRVAAFQPWNEPNLAKYLTPQWSGRQPVSPAIYRSMLNAFYAAVKAVDPGALVVTAGTAPFGDPFTGGERMPPVTFWRSLLCLRQAGAALRSTSCPDPAHFDVLAHHPYAIYGPTLPALDVGDVSVVDLVKLTRLLRAAERTGRALPHTRHQVWVTEVGWNTKPPNPGGVPIGRDARWLEQTLELLWRQGVDTIFWNTIVDEPPNPTYQDSSQSGLYFLGGQPKPALGAFEFPFLATRAPRSGVDVWGRAPAGGRLVIERRDGGTWRRVRTLPVARDRTFAAEIAGLHGGTVRALVGSRTSRSSTVG